VAWPPILEVADGADMRRKFSGQRWSVGLDLSGGLGILRESTDVLDRILLELKQESIESAREKNLVCLERPKKMLLRSRRYIDLYTAHFNQTSCVATTQY
jgi:hypothetical protein